MSRPFCSPTDALSTADFSVCACPLVSWSPGSSSRPAGGRAGRARICAAAGRCGDGRPGQSCRCATLEQETRRDGAARAAISTGAHAKSTGAHATATGTHTISTGFGQAWVRQRSVAVFVAIAALGQMPVSSLPGRRTRLKHPGRPRGYSHDSRNARSRGPAVANITQPSNGHSVGGRYQRGHAGNWEYRLTVAMVCPSGAHGAARYNCKIARLSN